QGLVRYSTFFTQRRKARKIRIRCAFCISLRLCVKYLMMKFFLFLLFSGIAILANSQGISPTHIHFTPTSFSNSFSLNKEPVLRIRPGDTVLTETIDAGGFDKNGVKCQKPGNPLTGPFYIENCSPGDALAVTITKLALNRSTAFTTESFSSRALPKTITKEFK